MVSQSRTQSFGPWLGNICETRCVSQVLFVINVYSMFNNTVASLTD